MYDLMRRAEALTGYELNDYERLWRWSVARPEQFWSLIWDHFGVIGEPGAQVLEVGQKIDETRCFPSARLNFAENLLRDSENTEAVVFWAEDQVKIRLTRSELRHRVAQQLPSVQSLPRLHRISVFRAWLIALARPVPKF
jgi:acetoacetyl-CoA synthetase